MGNLPENAQFFYRRFLIHNDYPSMDVNLETIRERLNLSDSNITNFIKTVESSILNPLNEIGIILSYKKTKAKLNG